MELRRLYKKDASGNVVYKTIGQVLDPEETMRQQKVVMKDQKAPEQVIGVEVLKVSKRWHLMPERFHEGLLQGWIQMRGYDRIALIGSNGTGEHIYRVRRHMGWYCCHCGAPLEDANVLEASGITKGLRHVQTMHAGKQSPDRNNPSGYERINYLDLELED